MISKKFLQTRHALALPLLASLALLGACASKGVLPAAELATARASISQAEGAGAVQLAPVDMLSARDKLGRAEAAGREERFAESRRMAEQAAADAEVAERKARAAKAKLAADELARANAALEKETLRKP